MGGMANTTGNIIEYVSRRTGSFDERPFNDVDALVLASLAYQRMPVIVPSLDTSLERYGSLRSRVRNLLPYRRRTDDTVIGTLRTLFRTPFPATTLADAYAALDNDDFAHGTGYTGLADPELTETLFRKAAANPRFASIRVGGTQERFSEEDQTQFAAMTMLLPDGTLVVAFRGTDTSFVGWKEDFNMAFRYPVPAQRSAAEYVTRVAGLWRGGLILLGHSKGGNLAVYAAMNVSDEVRARVRRVYSLDGPGFPRDVVEGEAYRAIVDRVVKIVPETSIVGMILETPEPCRVVRSNEWGLMQHLAFSWQVRGDAFVEVPDVSASSRYFNRSLNEWLAGMSAEQRERAVDALFTVLGASDEKGLVGLMEAGPKTIPAMLGTFAGLSDEDRRHLLEAATLLVKASLSIGGPDDHDKRDGHDRRDDSGHADGRDRHDASGHDDGRNRHVDENRDDDGRDVRIGESAEDPGTEDDAPDTRDAD